MTPTMTPPERPDEAECLAALRVLRVLNTPPDEALDLLTRLAANRFGVPMAMVSLADADRQWYKSRFGIPFSETRQGDSFCCHAIVADDVLVVLDAAQDPRFATSAMVTGAVSAGFYAGAPLVTAAGYRIGSFGIVDDKPRAAFSQQEREALQMMASLAMLRLEATRMRQDQPILQLIADTTTDAFVVIDQQSIIIHWNRGAEAMFGWMAAEAIGRSLELIVPDRHHHGHHQGIARILDGGRAKLVGKTTVVPALCRGGHEITVELSLGMWHAEGEGSPIAFASIMRDVSERKRQEADGAATKAVLAKRVAAIEACDDGIALTDADGIFVFMNRAHATMFGYPDAAHLLGKPWTILYEETAALEISTLAMAQAMREGRWRGEAQGRHVDGSVVYQEVSLTLSDDGGFVCVTRDIGGRLFLEREKARLSEQLMLAQRQEAVGQLASGIAHDFNNLIAAIAGTAGLLESHPDEMVSRNVGRIQKAASTATSLVDKLLGLGRRRSDQKDVDVRHLLTSVRDLVVPSLANKSHVVELVLPDAPLLVLADETELLQVVLNLALNARDALPNDSPGHIVMTAAIVDGEAPLGEIVVGRIPSGPAALIRVNDTGCGIPTDELRRIFQPFFTRKGDAGTGLGLAVVAGIITNAGGAVALSSRPGEGTTFELYWPLQSKPGSLPPRVPLPVGNAEALAGKTVLVVDDNVMVVETLASMLERAGAEPGPCVDPLDAIEALQDGPAAWDLVITDYDMPNMTGAELACRLRSIRADLPILLLTAQHQVLERRNGEAALFDGLLAKPVDLTELIEGALTALNARRCRA